MADAALTIIGSCILLRDSIVLASYHLKCLVEDSNTTIDDLLTSYLTPSLQCMYGMCALYAMPTDNDNNSDNAVSYDRHNTLNMNTVRRKIIRSACGEWWERVLFEPGGVSVWVEDMLGSQKKEMKGEHAQDDVVNINMQQAAPIISRGKDDVLSDTSVSTSDYDKEYMEDDTKVAVCAMDDDSGTCTPPSLSLLHMVQQAAIELLEQHTNLDANKLRYVRVGSIAALLLHLGCSRRARNIVTHVVHSSMLVNGVCGVLGTTGLLKLLSFEGEEVSSSAALQGRRKDNRRAIATVNNNTIARGVSAMMVLFVLMRLKRLLLHHR